MIVFQRIGQLSLLRDLLHHAYVSPAVRTEVFGDDVLPEWIEERLLTQPLAARIIASRLGAGEREAIALAFELGGAWLVIDDLSARRLALSLNIEVVGSLGLLVKAKERGLITAVRPWIETMQAEEFRASDEVVSAILAAASEV